MPEPREAPSDPLAFLADLPGPDEVSAGDYPIFSAILLQLRERDPAVRGTACWTLGQLRYRPAARPLSKILAKDPDAICRVQAAQALACLEGALATLGLIRGLKDDDDLVQETCIFGLARLEDPQAILPLEQFQKGLSEEHPLAKRAAWALAALQRLEEPGIRPDRRRGGVSRKISSYLEKVFDDPRDGIAHNNLAVAYFHAAEFPLAVRHCLLAKELGARVQWLWEKLVFEGYDPADSAISEEDRAFLESGSDQVWGGVEEEEQGGSEDEADLLGPYLRLEREPIRTSLGSDRDRKADLAKAWTRTPKSESESDGTRKVKAYRIPDRSETPPEAPPEPSLASERKSSSASSEPEVAPDASSQDVSSQDVSSQDASSLDESENPDLRSGKGGKKKSRKSSRARRRRRNR